jgi:hypothetical protein
MRTAIETDKGPAWEPRGSPSSYNGERQIWRPRPVTLITFNGVTTGSKTVKFRLPTPDARVRTKVALIGIPDPGGSPLFLAGKTLTLLLHSIEDAIDGGMPIPVTSLPDPTVGTAFTIPQNATLGGFSFETLTIGDAIEGTVSVTGTANAIKGRLVLQARFQPDGQRLPWDEWREIVSQCNPGLLSAAVTIG